MNEWSCHSERNEHRTSGFLQAEGRWEDQLGLGALGVVSKQAVEPLTQAPDTNLPSSWIMKFCCKNRCGTHGRVLFPTSCRLSEAENGLLYSNILMSQAID